LISKDHRDILKEFLDGGVEFLVVGAHALAAHGIPRATGDLDLWINRSSENVAKVWQALTRFGAPLTDLDPSDLEKPDVVYQVGVTPSRIEILSLIDGVAFGQAWQQRIEIDVEGLKIPVIGREDLIRNKDTVGRPQDIADIKRLKSLE
jgi:predicted nucleotidyltransferase